MIIICEYLLLLRHERSIILTAAYETWQYMQSLAQHQVAEA